MSILVIDVGTSGLRAAVVRPDASVAAEAHQPLLPSTPEPGLVEIDAEAIRAAALELAHAVFAEAGPVVAVGITNQRASAVVWDRATGAAVGPCIGWQDLRTVGTCLVLRGEGIHLAPNASATKWAFLLDAHDPDRTRDLCVGTVDSWLAWHLSEGALHVSDATNAGVTGLLAPDGSGWTEPVLEKLRIPPAALPRVVDTVGVVGEASALPGAPPIAALVGDQQASLVGQGCVRAGMAKATFGTGGMLDLNLGDERPAFARQGEQGCFPIVAWRQDGRITWGLEAVMLSAGTNVEWLRDDLGLIETAAASHDVASRCEHTDGVLYVPALLGLGTPHWDHGARGTLLGITRGTGRPEIVRAVLEGVAQRGADLLDAAEADAGCRVERLRIDGGMSDNPTFVQALANAVERPVEVAAVREATTLGAAYLAGMAVGTWDGWDDVADARPPRATVEPTAPTDRERWQEAVRRAQAWYPELSALSF
ncbi:MAG TPA: FGGY-family carbohydrate kinase [Acidimicrobiales bacterium]|nr:FGGY-family carbohydrate kinase [Acidimicrobiales bacterium]